MIKKFILIFNYVVVMTSPLWGPPLIIFKHKEKEHWNTWPEFRERLLEMGMCVMLPLVVPPLIFLFTKKGTKWINDNLEREDYNKLSVEDVTCFLMLFKYGNHDVVTAFKNPDLVNSTLNNVIKDARNSFSNITKSIGRHYVMNTEEKAEAGK